MDLDICKKCGEGHICTLGTKYTSCYFCRYKAKVASIPKCEVLRVELSKCPMCNQQGNEELIHFNKIGISEEVKKELQQWL